MVSFLPRVDADPERTPLLRPRPASRVASASCGPSRNVLASCDVFGTILMIRQDVIRHIDTPVSWQGLTEPALAFNLVRPLTEKYIALQNLSIIYCLLSNRLQFLHDSAGLPNARLSTTRAALCELLAIRVMTHYAKALETPATSAGTGTGEHGRGEGSSSTIPQAWGIGTPIHTPGPGTPFGSVRSARGGGAGAGTGTGAAAPPTLKLPPAASFLPLPRFRAAPTSPAAIRPLESGPAGATPRSHRPSSPVRSARSAAVSGARQRRMSMATIDTPMARLSKRRADELVLANVLIAGFHPFAGAPQEVKEEEEMEGRRGGGRACNALELAIVTNSKKFIACVACQRVLESVWSGRIYYTPSSFFDIVPDRQYKQKAITIYDARRAPLLDHYRLRVPRYRMMLEVTAFAVVFMLMIVVSNQKVVERATGWEIALMVYTVGWSFDRFATTLEHGLRIYAANLWNGIDAAIIFVFLLYLPIRLHGLITSSAEANDLALSILSCESALLFPRLAFTLMKRNVLVMSLRNMLSQFGVLMMAAVWIFVGFWHALYTLDEGNYSVWEIAMYMTNIWFGLDSTGFNLSPQFHPQLGPIIFFIFACLANTLFLTVVVAILSHTFAELNQDAKAEYMFRHAVAIVEGVKSDALFSYQPPLNLVALVTLGPASWLLSPRAFHRTHVFCTRLANAPILLLITLLERMRLALSLRPALSETLRRALPKRMQHVSLFMEGAHGDVYAVFDYAVDTVEGGRERGEDARWESEEEEEGGAHDAANSEVALEDEEDDEDDGSPVSGSSASTGRSHGGRGAGAKSKSKSGSGSGVQRAARLGARKLHSHSLSVSSLQVPPRLVPGHVHGHGHGMGHPSVPIPGAGRSRTDPTSGSGYHGAGQGAGSLVGAGAGAIASVLSMSLAQAHGHPVGLAPLQLTAANPHAHAHAQLGRSVERGRAGAEHPGRATDGSGGLLGDELDERGRERERRRASYPPVKFKSPQMGVRDLGDGGGDGVDDDDDDDHSEEARVNGVGSGEATPRPKGPGGIAAALSAAGGVGGSVPREAGEQAPPAWAAALADTLRRLEERQERLEGMLMPSEGD